MIPSKWVQLRHRRGGYLKRIGVYDRVESWAVMDDPREGGFLERADAEHVMADQSYAFNHAEFEIVPALACGCCGHYAADKSCGPWTLSFQQVSPDHWRCEKHVGRLPCCIEGCGKTFKMQPDDTYDHTVICGTHWREAPLRIRRQCRAIRAKAKRFGWTERLLRLHDTAWQRGLAAIQHGRRLDMTEINRMFGWNDD